MSSTTVFTNTIECIYNQPALLGESPLWDAQQQMLYWVDIEKSALHCLDPQTKYHRVWSMPSEIGCIALRAGGGLVAALRYGFAYIELPSGHVTMMDTVLADADGVMFNDGKCDRAGRFWAGTKDLAEQNDIGALYRLDATGRSTEITKGYAVANGFAWSPDNTIFYVCNSSARIIYQYDFDLKAGTLNNKRIFATLSEESGYPDGVTVDSEGGVWNAHWDGGRVTRYLPNGKIDDVIKMPVRRPTSCCFGGANLTTLYVTSASTRLSAEELKQDPFAGCVFAVEVGIKGLIETKFIG